MYAGINNHISLRENHFEVRVKSMFSKKATKVDEISSVKSKEKILSIFVSFLENVNCNILVWHTWCENSWFEAKEKAEVNLKNVHFLYLKYLQWESQKFKCEFYKQIHSGCFINLYDWYKFSNKMFKNLWTTKIVISMSLMLCGLAFFGK